jgi:hypothetical protein
MYIDAIVVVALIIVAFCWFRRFSKMVYAVGIIDIFLRLINYISANIGIPGFNEWVIRIFPTSIPGLLDRYMDGILLTVFVWIYVFFMVVFLFYATRTFIRKR